jgi:type II restriction/modification system DNA methylase subunit YeeA
VQGRANDLVARCDIAVGGQRTRLENELQGLLLGFQGELASIRVLDPACGSGNFLYVALKQLLDLEKEVIVFMGDAGLTRPFPIVSPEQLCGIELNEYAHELAQITVWIGYIQWLRDNGFGQPSEPILKPLDTIVQMDAILAFNAEGQPVEPVWPEADVIIGNPPFLGDRKMRSELGHEYVDRLRELYAERLPGASDLVCYWFERGRVLMAEDKTRRAGLLATNSIRGGANRRVLERIRETGNIFMAWSDRPWVLDGAAVRVSMVGFDDGTEPIHVLDGVVVSEVNPDLTASLDLTQAMKLSENEGIAYYGTVKIGPFDIEESTARALLADRGNPNGRPNSDVVKPWMNATDIAQRSRSMWAVDFGVNMPLEDAAEYQKPFEYVRANVKPMRDTVRRRKYREVWWLFGEPCPSMRRALAALPRYAATPALAKHRLFVWLSKEVVPDHALTVFARADDYFLGILQSRPHELWALRMGTSLEDRPRYTPTTTFATFPLPWTPSHEPAGDPRVEAIAQAARELVEKRDRWLNPEGADDAILKKRTLTNLYNERPTWLDLAHRKLDYAVLDAYGWPHDLSDDEILARLLALNLERAGAQGGRPLSTVVTTTEDEE